MLDQRLRRRPNINTTLRQRLVSAEGSPGITLGQRQVTGAKDTVIPCVHIQSSLHNVYASLGQRQLIYNLCYSCPCGQKVASSKQYTLTNVGILLGQRRRRWANVQPTLDQRLCSWHCPAKPQTNSVVIPCWSSA